VYDPPYFFSILEEKSKCIGYHESIHEATHFYITEQVAVLGDMRASTHSKPPSRLRSNHSQWSLIIKYQSQMETVLKLSGADGHLWAHKYSERLRVIKQ
jgi:hypothetical protein